jgi:hypothetical protein
MSQHGRQLMPVRCAYSTILQLHSYFEDVVLENNLTALVIESLPLSSKRATREKARIRELARGGRRAFFFVPHTDAINQIVSSLNTNAQPAPVLLPQGENAHANEHFIVIADARFSALLATVHGRNNDTGGDEVIWTFEPDIVYSALEYLMARVGVEHPYHAPVFGDAVRTSMPKATSLQLTVGVTTKLAHLLQEQAGREIAVNRIATAIRESLELGVILQKTVDEVGAAPMPPVARCAWMAPANRYPYYYFKQPDNREVAAAHQRELDRHCVYFAEHQGAIVCDSDDETMRPTIVCRLPSCHSYFTRDYY